MSTPRIEGPPQGQEPISFSKQDNLAELKSKITQIGAQNITHNPAELEHVKGLVDRKILQYTKGSYTFLNALRSVFAKGTLAARQKEAQELKDELISAQINASPEKYVATLKGSPDAPIFEFSYSSGGKVKTLQYSLDRNRQLTFKSQLERKTFQDALKNTNVSRKEKESFSLSDFKLELSRAYIEESLAAELTDKTDWSQEKIQAMSKMYANNWLTGAHFTNESTNESLFFLPTKSAQREGDVFAQRQATVTFNQTIGKFTVNFQSEIVQSLSKNAVERESEILNKLHKNIASKNGLPSAPNGLFKAQDNTAVYVREGGKVNWMMSGNPLEDANIEAKLHAVTQILEGMAYAHSQNIAHKNIAADKIFVSQEDLLPDAEVRGWSQGTSEASAADKEEDVRALGWTLLQYFLGDQAERVLQDPSTRNPKPTMGNLNQTLLESMLINSNVYGYVKDLIEGMLASDPSKRLTMQAAYEKALLRK